ncbi:MAG TPA: IclR family transcriptional regulator [Bacillota bacterium]|jgi:DNA-binding IclR family transcriptional regulator|nr:IclR family transcriptional regulator [Bacillota bacterium]HOB86212.1 IclR family transcriptional regulator [Bacillota bacterium]HOP68766.1 IclR family transcriptional regulator [Bacillota bacterium]HPT33867.1 IclR family transcriptional regulator [Bacillota bacterium]HPZ64561.1 IclR family transcriptional regulator [Bacillota bacterium]
MAKKTKSSTSYGVQALERALYLMEMIKEKGGADANYLAKELGVHRSSVYRILGALQRWGYVRQDSQNMKFQLGLKFIEMANQVDFFHELRLLAIPYMEKLMQHTRETTHLMTLENDHVFYLAKVESPETIRMFSRVGVRRPAYCTAGGKVLLAFLPPRERKQLVENMTLEPHTENTIQDREKLLQLLEEVAQRGWAIEIEENEPGVCCAGAPIFRKDGEVVAALTVSCPVFRTPREKLLGFLPMLMETAGEISQALGGSVPKKTAKTGSRKKTSQ